jgi:hypothetical protein
MLTDESTRIAFDLRYVTCPSCGENLVSIARHDFQQCKCPAQTFIDGGQVDYYRVGGMQVDTLHLKLGDFILDLSTDERILIDDKIRDLIPDKKKTRLLKQEEVRKELKSNTEQGV